MKAHSSVLVAAALLVLVILLIYPKVVSRGAAPKVRPTAVAGTFYPADPKELGSMLDGFLAHATPAPVQDLKIVALTGRAGGDWRASTPINRRPYEVATDL